MYVYLYVLLHGCEANQLQTVLATRHKQEHQACRPLSPSPPELHMRCAARRIWRNYGERSNRGADAAQHDFNQKLACYY